MVVLFIYMTDNGSPSGTRKRKKKIIRSKSFPFVSAKSFVGGGFLYMSDIYILFDIL